MKIIRQKLAEIRHHVHHFRRINAWIEVRYIENKKAAAEHANATNTVI